jgi:hypothetical protein
MTPAEKLAQSRLAIVEYLARNERRHEDAGTETLEAFDAADGGASARRKRRPRGGGWFSRLMAGAHAWWDQHPAQIALELASPVLGKALRKHPFQVLGASAAAGALLVVTRPWRLFSLTTLGVAILKSSRLSAVVMSALTDGHGWHDAQGGREPQ